MPEMVSEMRTTGFCRAEPQDADGMKLRWSEA